MAFAPQCSRPAIHALVGMPSTVIRRFRYSPEESELLVEFVSGRRYCYEGVPEREVERLKAAFAKGVHFNRHIRGRYPAREVGAAD